MEKRNGVSMGKFVTAGFATLVASPLLGSGMSGSRHLRMFIFRIHDNRNDNSLSRKVSSLSADKVSIFRAMRGQTMANHVYECVT